MKKLKDKVSFCWQIFFASLLFIIFSCSKKKSYEANSGEKNSKIKPPVVIPAGNPVVVSLDTCAQPYYNVIPLKDSVDYVYHTKDGPIKIKLAPPLIKPADYFITLPNYNDEKGLGINSIMAAYCAKDGTLWFGTNGGGVTHYDGKTSVTFTSSQGLGNNIVSAIAEDQKQNMWFGTNGGGVTKYDGRLFTGFTSAQGLVNNGIQSITIDKKGSLWFGTNGGISRYDGKNFENFTTGQGLISNMITCSMEDRQGNLWVGSYGGGVSCYNGKEFINYSVMNGLVSNYVNSIVEDADGNMWFGTYGGVSKYDGKTFTRLTVKEGLANNYVLYILEDKKRNLWFGTFDGVSCYNGKSFFNISTKQGLANKVVGKIIEDKQGNLWFGTFGGGVSCYNGRSVLSYTEDQGLPDLKVWGITEDNQGNLWFGTNAGGICKYDGKSFTHFSTPQGLNGSSVACLFEDSRKRLWIGKKSGGASFYDKNTFTSFTKRHGFPGTGVQDIIEDELGNLWFASGDGVSKYDGKIIANLNKSHGLADNNVNAIVEDDKGRLWIGTYGNGISCYDGKSFINFSKEQGLVDNFIIAVTRDRKGNLWFATGGGGISIVKKEILDKLGNINSLKPDEKTFQNFTTQEGLSDDAVYGVVEDKEGNILISTRLGITVIKGGLDRASNIIAKEKIEYYNIKSGYSIKDGNGGAMFTDSKGIVWQGTGQKLVRFDYSAIKRDLNPPEVRIQSIKINNEKITWYNLLLDEQQEGDSIKGKVILQSLLIEEAIVYGRTQIKELRDSMRKKFSDIEFDSITAYNPLPVNLKLPYKHNSVTFDFAAMEPGRPGRVRYQYILKNYDKEWSSVTAQSTATFGNIYEGSYKFMVKAQSPDGIWSKPVEYSFKVLPPLWRTQLFIILYILFTGFILFFLIRYRVSSVRKKEKEKAKHEKELLELEAKALRAQMNPHFIFNCLNSIKSLIQQHEEKKSVNYLTTFSKLIRTLFNNADKKDITLYDEIETCKLYLQLEAMRFDTKFSYAVNVDENLDLKSVLVPALIIQPFIENAIWHGIVPKGEGGHVELSVEKKDNDLEISIDDNGIGREASKQNKPASSLTHQSKGVNLTQSRLELDNLLRQRKAQLKTMDKKDENGRATGTKVIMTINEETV